MAGWSVKKNLIIAVVASLGLVAVKRQLCQSVLSLALLAGLWGCSTARGPDATSPADVSAGLAFELCVASLELKLPPANETTPILMLWKVKNTTDHRVILPTGSATILELVDRKGRPVPGGESRDGFIALAHQDYRFLDPGWSTYVSVGDLSLYTIDHKVFIGGPSARGGWIKYGPLAPGNYKLRCIFLTDLDASEYAYQLGFQKALWLGEFTSAWLRIDVKP